LLISQHVVSGAVLGRALRRPGPALLAGVVSHYLLDLVPHWGRPRTAEPLGMDGAALRVAVGDGLTGLALIAAVVAATPRRHLPGVLAGVVGACLPDLDKPALLFVGRSPFPQRHDDWHAGIQTEFPGLLRRDAALVVGTAAVVVAALHAERRLSG
jgi:hypothetical protein